MLEISRFFQADHGTTECSWLKQFLCNWNFPDKFLAQNFTKCRCKIIFFSPLVSSIHPILTRNKAITLTFYFMSSWNDNAGMKASVNIKTQDLMEQRQKNWLMASYFFSYKIYQTSWLKIHWNCSVEAFFILWILLSKWIKLKIQMTCRCDSTKRVPFALSYSLPGKYVKHGLHNIIQIFWHMYA